MFERPASDASAEFFVKLIAAKWERHQSIDTAATVWNFSAAKQTEFIDYS